MGEAFEVGVEKGWIYGWYVCNYRSKGEEPEVPGHICQRGMDESIGGQLVGMLCVTEVVWLRGCRKDEKPKKR